MNLKNNVVTDYLFSAWEEFGKITWPTKEQAAMLSAVVIVVSLIFVLLIGVTDLGFSEAYKYALDLLSK